MKTYLLSLLTAAIVAIFVSQLAPEGERGGIAKHVRLISSLFLICVLLSPVQTLIRELPSLLDGEWLLSESDTHDDSVYREQFEAALNQASASYFTDMLTQTLCTELSLSPEELQCKVFWDPSASKLTPTRVTVLLSGSAIWKDPTEIRALVDHLIGCTCDVVIE